MALLPSLGLGPRVRGLPGALPALDCPSSTQPRLQKMKSPETLRLETPGGAHCHRDEGAQSSPPAPVPPTSAPHTCRHPRSASRPPCTPSLLQAPSLHHLPQEALLCCPAARTRFLRAPCAPLPFPPALALHGMIQLPAAGQNAREGEDGGAQGECTLPLNLRPHSSGWVSGLAALQRQHPAPLRPRPARGSMMTDSGPTEGCWERLPEPRWPLKTPDKYFNRR